MLGECDKCGEHGLDCKCEELYQSEPNERFFYKGKFFNNEAEFWKYSKDWTLMHTDQETFFREWDRLGKDIWMNIEVREIPIINMELNKIFQESFLHLLHKFISKNDKE